MDVHELLLVVVELSGEIPFPLQKYLLSILQTSQAPVCVFTQARNRAQLWDATLYCIVFLPKS